MRTESAFLLAHGTAEDESARVAEKLVEIVREGNITGYDPERQAISYARHNFGRFGMDVRILLQARKRGAEIKRCTQQTMTGGGRNACLFGLDLQSFEPDVFVTAMSRCLNLICKSSRIGLQAAVERCLGFKGHPKCQEPALR